MARIFVLFSSGAWASFVEFVVLEAAWDVACWVAWGVAFLHDVRLGIRISARNAVAMSVFVKDMGFFALFLLTKIMH